MVFIGKHKKEKNYIFKSWPNLVVVVGSKLKQKQNLNLNLKQEFFKKVIKKIKNCKNN